jgi:hypothetical protein
VDLKIKTAVEGGEKKMAIVSGGEPEVCDRSIDGADDDILFPVFSLSLSALVVVALTFLNLKK